MHKIMQAMKDGEIGTDLETDGYHYNSSENFTRGDNVNFTEVMARSPGFHYKHRVDFGASKFAVVENTSETELQLEICWFAQGGEYSLFNNEMQTVNENSISLEVEYTVYEWDPALKKFKYVDDYKALVYNLDMNEYYENGKFTSESATVLGDSECTSVAVDLLNEAFDGLNEVYTEKGYPIK